MTLCTIDLQEGFTNEFVVIRLDGLEIFNNKNVSTRTQIGLAERVIKNMHKDWVNLEIELPFHKIKIYKKVDLKAAKFIGINLQVGNKLFIKEQNNEFWYV